MSMSRATRLAVPLLAALATGGHAQAQGIVGDRYGAQPSAYPAAGPATVTPFRGRMLAWPGKQAASAAPVRDVGAYAAPQPYGQTRYPAVSAVHTTYAPAALRQWGRPAAMTTASVSDQRPTGRYDAAYPTRPLAVPASYAEAPAADDGWRPVFAAPTAPGGRQPRPVLDGAPSPSPLPTSIYSPPATSPRDAVPLSPAARAAVLPPPMRGSAAQRYGYDPTQDHTVRFYSVHRAFGLQPDPAPIPPQFFTATADLAAPPGPLTTERTTTTSAAGSSSHAVHATPDAGTD